MSSGPRETALQGVGFVLPGLWLQARAEKPQIIFIFLKIDQTVSVSPAKNKIKK